MQKQGRINKSVQIFQPTTKNNILSLFQTILKIFTIQGYVLDKERMKNGLLIKIILKSYQKKSEKLDYLEEDFIKK